MSCGAITIPTSGQPQNVSQSVGGDVTFTVTPTPQSGITYTYQWFIGDGAGAAIPGEISSSYTKTNVQVADSATNYSCVITASPGSCTVQSNHAVLFVTGAGGTAPTITTQPVTTQTASPGDDVTISVVASGSSPLHYQWFQGNVDLEVNSATLLLNNISSGQAGIYRVFIYNAAGFVLSNSSQLVIAGGPGGVPVIISQPTSQTVATGETATFSVVVSSPTAVTYQWFFNNTAISGATSASYSTIAIQSAVGQYKVTATNAVSSVTSSPVFLILGPPSKLPPVFTTQPTSLTVKSGAPAVFTAVTNDQVASFQWFHGAAVVSGATSSILTIQKVTKTDAGTYYVNATNSAGTTKSSEVTLTVTTNLTWLWIVLAIVGGVLLLVIVIIILVLATRPPKKPAAVVHRAPTAPVHR